MSFISDELGDVIKKFQKEFRLNLAFDAVLYTQKLFSEELSDMEKIETALAIVVINRHRLRKLSPRQKSDLLTDIYHNFIIVPQKTPTSNNKKLFDFEEDGEYIYSSFLMDYGIDLVDMQGKLHWKKFMALFRGLSDKTKIKEIMGIRGREIPEPTKYNQKEIKSLMELKAYYALGVEEENYQEGLGALFNTLERMAE